MCGRRAAGIASQTPTGLSRTPLKTVALLEAAMRLGPSVSTICDHIHRHEAEAGVRRILGVLALAKQHLPAVVEDAAKAALEVGVPTYRFLRRYLERRPPVPLTLRQVDPLIRQLMGHVCPESRRRDTGLGLLRRGHRHLPTRVRVSGNGDRHPSDSALEYHRTPDSRVDDAAVQKLRDRRGTVPVPGA
jgi:hypothetical protein